MRFVQKNPLTMAGRLVRSECDSQLMRFAGNLLTDFNFHLAAIRCRVKAASVDLTIASAEEPAAICLRRQAPEQLSPYSAFASMAEAQAFLKYEPYGLSVNEAGMVNVVRVLRDEEAWHSRLCSVTEAYWAFFADKAVRPEIAFEVAPISYRWLRGRLVRPEGER